MLSIKKKNIFVKLPAAKAKEAFDTLYEGRNVKVERIVSCGQKTPENVWLSERKAEWVMVLQGKARLEFRSPHKEIELKAGDHVLIPADTPHRVAWTHPQRKTVWLAVHAGC